MEKVKQALHAIDPDGEFEGSFLDENIDRMYRSEARLAKISISGAVVAIVISCLGLFAIAVLVIAQRNKEIGVRKVLGASVSGIVTLIAKDFLRLVLVAILIATPVAWYLMRVWLQDFAYHIDVKWWVFLLAGIAAIVIAFCTISFQSVKAALMNPVKSLKTE
jgi:ABC-type antimicrobial peptide transport system permease subunit